MKTLVTVTAKILTIRNNKNININIEIESTIK